MIPALIVVAVTLVIIPILGFAKVYGTTGYALTIVFVVITACASALVQGSVFGVAAVMGMKYINAALIGNALAALVMCAIRVFTKAVIPIDKSLSEDRVLLLMTANTSIYFFASTLIIVACIIAYFVLITSEFFKYHSNVASKSVEVRPDLEGIDQDSAFSGMELSDNKTQQPANADSTISQDQVVVTLTPNTHQQLEVGHGAQIEASQVDPYLITPVEENPLTLPLVEPTTKDTTTVIAHVTKPVNVFTIIGKVYVQALGVFFCFFITASIFPGMVIQIKSTYGDFMKEWLGVIFVVVFTVFDFLGRTSANYGILFRKQTVLIPVLLRLIFIPLFLMCNKVPSFGNDFIPITLMALMALTNGYLASVTMMYGTDEADVHEKATASNIMSFCLLFGLFAGSMVGLGLSYVLV